MVKFKSLMGAATVAVLLSSTAALADPATRSTVASLKAPVKDVRTATKSRLTSRQEGAGAGVIVGATAATAALIAGIVVVATDNDDEPDSAG